MLVSGVMAGIALATAFGGDWRRLGTLSLRFWPRLPVALAIRLTANLTPGAPLGAYISSLLIIAIVAASNWRLPGSNLVSLGTAMKIVVVTLNGGMPYDPITAAASGLPIPTHTLHPVL